MDSGQETSTSKASTNHPWWKAIVEVSALVTVFAATIYVLGLFAVWLPLFANITHNFTTSWYAISLMPRMAIVGQGVTKLVGLPLIVVLAVVVMVALIPFMVTYVGRLVAFIVPHRLRKWISKVTPNGLGTSYVRLFGARTDFDTIAEWYQVTKRGFANSTVAYWVTAAILMLLLYRENLASGLILYSMLFIGLHGGDIGGTFVKRALVRREAEPYAITRQWFMRGLFVVYVTSVINGFIASLDDEPALLRVRMDYEEIKVGRLVTHSNGYWYVFDKEGNLRAVPDADAGHVRISKPVES